MAEETLSPIPHIHEDEPLNGMGKDETSEPHETKIDSDKSPEEIEHRQDATLLPGTADNEIKIGAWRIYRPNTEFDGLFQSRIYFSVEASFEAMPGMHFRLNNKIISQEALQTSPKIRAGLQISLCETKFSKKVCGDKYVLFGFCPERADRIVAFVCSVTTFQFSAVAFPCGWCYPLYENMEFFKEHQTQFKTSLVEYFAMEEKKRDSPLVVIPAQFRETRNPPKRSLSSTAAKFSAATNDTIQLNGMDYCTQAQGLRIEQQGNKIEQLVNSALKILNKSPPLTKQSTNEASTEKVTKLSAEIAALKEKNKALESKIRDLEESKAQVVEELRQIKVEAGDAQQRIYDLALAAVARPTHELPATSTKRSSRSVLPDTPDTDYTYQLTHKHDRRVRTSKVQSDSEGYTYSPSPPRRQKGPRLGAPVRKRQAHEHMHDSDSADGDSLDRKKTRVLAGKHRR